MKLKWIIGLAIVALGVVLLAMGISAADSLSSDVSRFFTGEVTDRDMLLIIGGVVLIIIGLGAGAVPDRVLKR